MSKAFWDGFRDGYLQTSKYVLPIAFALLAGWSFGMYFHPYEKCLRMYDISEDISECTLLLREK